MGGRDKNRINNYDMDAGIKAITEYVYFIENSRGKDGKINFNGDYAWTSDPKKFDARRKELHLAIGRVFGLTEKTRPTCEDAIRFTVWGDDWQWDTWIKHGDKLEDYIEWKYWDIIDEINKTLAPHQGIATCYRLKLHMDSIIEDVKEEIAKRMKPIDEVMEEYRINHNAWDNDHSDGPYIYDHSNRHDYNGYRYSIRCYLESIELFAKQPMEAYLKIAVDEYVYGPQKSIRTALSQLEGIAFRAQERYKTEPFYKYLENKAKQES